MIEKVIHYCWFGKNPLDERSKKCIESWKKYCPDYTIIEWNESNFDINSNIFVKEAYESKKWAFVTDYVRLYVLYNYGGIYMDTDVELLQNLDSFLNNVAFSGFENNALIPTGIMASEKHGEWINYLMSYYNNRHFINSDGTLNTSPNTGIITNMTISKYKIEMDNTYQEIKNVLVLYPSEFFCPKNHLTGEIELTDNTVCIHHFNGSWITKKEKARHKKIYKYSCEYADLNWYDMNLYSKLIRLIKWINAFGLKQIFKK